MSDNSVVIVALPRKDDMVNRISSNPAAHMTILYLEDGSTFEDIVKYVEHASSFMTRFYMEIEERTTLGDKDADVLLFKTGGYRDESVRKLRDNLLKDNNLNKAYLSVDQFPSWIPHLTLGYPDKPANEKLMDDYGRLYSIEFDRIAVWDGNYEGPEFKLKGFEDFYAEDSVVAHADTSRTVQDVLDGMDDDERTVADVIMGALTEDETIPSDFVEAYDDFTDEQKSIFEFLVGAYFSPYASVTHSDLEDPVDSFLAHYGVKGMRWGVRNVDRPSGLSRSSKNTSAGRKEARAKVKAGTATLADSHLAALKSKGHRALNAITGDKQFWKTMAISTVAVVGVTAAAVALTPAVIPATIITFNGSAGIGGALGVGAAVAPGYAGYLAAIAGAGFNNIRRATRGNSQVSKSYEKMGAELKKTQTAGSDKVKKLLSQSGGLSKRKLTEPDSQSLSSPSVKAPEAPDKTGDNSKLSNLDTLGTMLDTVAGPPGILHYIPETDNFLAHFGIRGMRWGVRRQRGSDGTVAGGVKESESKKSGSGDDSANPKGGGSGSVPEMSTDARKALDTIRKSPSEMSTQEIREAVERARQLKAYNEIFNPEKTQGTTKIEERIKSLKQTKELRQLEAEMAPTSAVTKFINTAGKGLTSFKTLDALTGGKLSQNLATKMGLNKPTELDLIKQKADELKIRNDLVRQQTAEINALASLTEAQVSKAGLVIGDFPSLAPDYANAGKRSKNGAHRLF